MNFRHFYVLPIFLTAAVSVVYPAMASQSGGIETVQNATNAYSGIMADPKTQIPKSILRNAQGIAIFPNVTKVGFIVGGSNGNGVILTHSPKGEWSNPCFISISGGSVGLQAGGQTSEIVMVFRTAKSIKAVLTNEFSLGGEVAAAAGPVGGNVVAPTDPNADIYSYARSKGLFGGVSLKGQKIAVQNDRNADFYVKPGITAQQILTTQFSPPSAVANVVVALKQALNQSIAAR